MSLFDRIKVWEDEEGLSNEDLNDEIDNVLDHLTAEFLVGWSTNVSQMQQSTSPGGVGTESLSASVSDELERLRYAIARITGEAYWYVAPDINLSAAAAVLSQTGTFPQNRVTSGRVRTDSNQSLFLVPAGNTTTVTVKAGGSNPNLEYYVNGTAYTLSADVTKSSLTVAPASNNTCLVDDAALVGAESSKIVGENNVYGQWNGSNLTVDTMGTEIQALVGKLAAFKVGAEYFLAFVESSTRLSRCYRGFFFDSSGNPLPRVAISNNDTITLMKLGWLFLTTAGAVDVTYVNPAWQGTAPSSPATGDYWFDSINQTWKKYDGASWNSSGATYIGMAIMNGTVCIAARAVEYFAVVNSANSLNMGVYSNSEVRSTAVGPKISVAGSLIDFGVDFAKWTNPTHAVSGVTVSANTTYYLYVSNTGKAWISNQYPYVRDDLLGLYHPHHTWRCVGTATTDGSANFSTVENFGRPHGHQLQGLSIPTGALEALSVTSDKIALAAVGYAQRGTLNENTSASCGAFNTGVNNASQPIPNHSVTLNTNGKSVWVGMIPDGNTDLTIHAAWGGLAGVNIPTFPLIRIFRDATVIAQFTGPYPGVTNQYGVGPCSIFTVDSPAQGNYTYSAQLQNGNNGTTVFVQYVKLKALEMG